MRLFIALELEQTLKDELVRLQGRLERFADDLKFTNPAQLHLTLSFIGETEDTRLEQIQACMTETAGGFNAFEISLTESGCFPPHGSPRVIWTGISESTGTLVKLQSELEASLAEIGLKAEERKFSPHLTLTRVRDGRKTQGLREAVEKLKPSPLLQKVGVLSLIESVLKPEGAEHSTVFSAPLKAVT